MAHTRSALCLCLVLGLALANAELKLQQVDRKIDLRSQLVRITESIKAKNTGITAEGVISLCWSTLSGAKLAFVKVLGAGKEELKVSDVTIADAPSVVTCRQVTLTAPLPAGEVVSLTATAVLATAQTPFPTELSQHEAQLMVYTDNLYVQSPYQVSAQSTEIQLPGEVKSYSDKVKPASKSGNTVKLGRYDLVKPFTQEELRVHFANPKPFKHVMTYVKEIEVSHWGNIYVEEKYELKNAGAKHTGSFSRLRYAHAQGGKSNSFRDMRARLPLSAHSMYYVDLIGNISTSNIRKTTSETLLDFDIRYPLMGGWSADFTLGYSVPLKGSLFRKRSDSKHRLTLDLSCPLEDVYVESLEVRVVLPEGAARITPVLPYAMDHAMDTKFTYLDTTGRPVVVLRKQHVVPEHSAKFSVDYSFATTSMLREPVLLIMGFFILLLSVVVYNRMEFTITKDEKWQEGMTREKVATLMEQLGVVLEEYADAAAKYSKLAAGASGTSKEAATKQRGAVEKQLKDMDAKVQALLAEVDAISPRAASAARAVVDKATGVAAKHARVFSEALDSANKGLSTPETSKRLAPLSAAAGDASKDLANAINNVFSSY